MYPTCQAEYCRLAAKKLPLSCDVINIISYNARSINKKAAGITEFLNNHNCDVCLICESWVGDDFTSIVAEFSDYGYEVLQKGRKNKRSGGLCALYKNNLGMKKSDIKINPKTFEVMEVTIKGISSILRISTIYRTGKMSSSEFEDFMIELEDYLGACPKTREKHNLWRHEYSC